MSKSLRQYVEQKKDKKDKLISFRTTKKVYKDFNDYCSEIGISVSEALELLIKQELYAEESECNTKSKQEVSQSNKQNVIRDSEQPVIQNSTQNVNKNKSSTPTNKSGRFTTKPYEVAGKLPCPICKDWFSHRNFSRHAKSKHNKTTMELFEENKEVIQEMVKGKL